MSIDEAQNVANAKAAHEYRYKSAHAVQAPVFVFAVEALKSSILINGGTAGALLAFVGQKGIAAQPGLGQAFYWFAGGLLAGAFATVFSYGSQYFYSCSMFSYINTWKHPYVEDTKWCKRHAVIATVLHSLAVIAVLLSFAAAVRGFWIAGNTLPF